MEECDVPHLSEESEEDHEDPIPSNQLAGDQRDTVTTNNNSQRSQPPRGSQDDEEEDNLESWGILMQYIGFSTIPKDNNRDNDNRKHLAAKKELDNFKWQCAADSDLRDQAQNHLEGCTMKQDPKG